MADMISRRGKSKKFTDRFVATAASGFYFDAGCPTLCLKVKPTGTRSWVQKISIQGKQTMLGLGGIPSHDPRGSAGQGHRPPAHRKERRRSARGQARPARPNL